MLSTRGGQLQQAAVNRTPFDPHSGRTVLQTPTGEARLFRCCAPTDKQWMRNGGRHGNRGGFFLQLFCRAYYHAYEARDGQAPCGHSIDHAAPVRPVNGRIAEALPVEIARWRVQIRERLAGASVDALRRYVREFSAPPQVLPENAAAAAYSFLCLVEGVTSAQEWVRHAAAAILDAQKVRVAA